MRIVPIITAVLVCGAIYLFVMQRDTLRAIAGTTVKTVDENALVTRQKPPVSVVALKSQAQSVDSALVLRGRTEAFRNVDVKSETSGLVISTPLRRGQMVKAGDVLCELDPGTKQAELAEARAQLAEAQANSKAALALVLKGFTSETAAKGSEAALQSAQAVVQRAERELSRLQMLAPFSGLLETDTAELGALLQPGALCGNVIALDPIKLVGFAPEDQISQIKTGANAAARLVSGREVFGELTFLSRSADPLTRTFRVEVTAPNPSLEIRDGTTAEIIIQLEGKWGHFLPISSLTLNDEGIMGVRGVKQSTTVFYPVTIIRDTPDGVWVTGPPDTAEIIVTGQEFVVEGRKVTVTYRDSAS